MATCPYCKIAPAYVAFNTVECSNTECDHYSAEMYPVKVELQPTEEDTDDDMKPVYYWSHHHHDFGD